MDRRSSIRLASGAGLWVGGLAWLASTVLNHALTPWSCATGLRLIPIIAAVLAVVALAGAWVSVNAFRRRISRLETETPRAGTPFEMMAVIGIVTGVLFAVVIILQAAAGLFLTGCEI